jgi:hypothetical protein
MASRMTQQSLANARVADRFGVEPMDDGTGWLAWVERAGNRAYVSGVDGPIRYKDYKSARRVVIRLRPDLGTQPSI